MDASTDRYRCGLPVAMLCIAAGGTAMIVATAVAGVSFVKLLLDPAVRAYGVRAP